MSLTLMVNGTSHTVDVEPETPLLWVLRDEIGLTGTKYGCGISKCGACTVLVGGKKAFSCTTKVSAAVGKEITTIEGLSDDNSHPLQVAVDRRGRSAVRLLPVRPDHGGGGAAQPAPRSLRSRYRAAMADNICRCGTYTRIRKAIHRAAEIAQG